MILGGELKDVPKPWKFYFDDTTHIRHIEIKSIVFTVHGYAIGANGHHHCDIREEDNMVWDISLLNNSYQSNKEDLWRKPGLNLNHFTHEDFELQHKYIDGRKAMNTNLFTKRDVVKWAVSILREWDVLKNKRYKITWDLDEDDPYANPGLARFMRKRAMSGD